MLTAGSRGDVHPYVALAVGLRAAGHAVRLAAPPPFEEMVLARGLEYAPTARALAELTSGARWQRWQESGDRPVAYVRGALEVARGARPVIESLIDDYWAACQGAELVISSSSAIGGPLLAGALAVPHCWALIQPWTHTRAFPFFLTPPGLRLGPALNAYSYRIAERTYWMLFKSAVTRWSVRRTGRPPRRRELRSFFGAEPGAVLYGFSPSVVARPADWGPHIVQCGYWFAGAPPGWRPPGDLAAFVRAGPPPVVLALESMGFSGQDDLLGITVEALARAGCRGIVLASGEHADRALPETMLSVSDVPFDWLFPQTAAVVHHGGAGTVASALRAGVPSVGVPSFYDQVFWSGRIAALGVGPTPIPRRRLTAAKLGDALSAMTRTRDMRERAARLGDAIRDEAGVERAVGGVHGFLRDLGMPRA